MLEMHQWDSQISASFNFSFIFIASEKMQKHPILFSDSPRLLCIKTKNSQHVLSNKASVKRMNLDLSFKPIKNLIKLRDTCFDT